MLYLITPIIVGDYGPMMNHATTKSLRAKAPTTKMNPAITRSLRPMTPTPITDIQDAINLVLTLCKDEYAKAYAAASRGMTGKELYVQVLYITGNLATWRGDEARATKAYFKEWLKANK